MSPLIKKLLDRFSRSNNAKTHPKVSWEGTQRQVIHTLKTTPFHKLAHFHKTCYITHTEITPINSKFILNLTYFDKDSL